MAATDKVSGVDGALTIGGTTFVLTEFSLEVSGGIIDVTDSSCTDWREKIPSGFKDWRGTAKGFLLDGTATPTVGAAAASCVFTAESGLTYTGDGIVTTKAINLDVPGENAVTVDITIEGAGSLTEANS